MRISLAVSPSCALGCTATLVLMWPRDVLAPPSLPTSLLFDPTAAAMQVGATTFTQDLYWGFIHWLGIPNFAPIDASLSVIAIN